MSDLDGVLQTLYSLEGEIAEGIALGLRKAGKKIQADAKRLAPSSDGLLRESIIETLHQEDDEFVEEVGTNVAYAAYTEFGTGPVGAASPKVMPPDKMLTRADYTPKESWRYRDLKTGQWYTTSGQPARPFLYPALKQNQADVNDIVAKEVKKAYGR